MSDYVKCPMCDLNYIKSGENYCNACNPKFKGKLLSDIEERNEVYRQKKMQEYQARRESMNAFYAIRYNTKHK